MTQDIVIVGAGIAGLTAALCLQQAGREVQVFDAATSVGGRVQAVRDASGQPMADLGPSWIWPRWQPVFRHWVDRLSLDEFAQFDDGDAVLEGFGGPPRRQKLLGQDGLSRLRGGPSALVQALGDRLVPGTVTCRAEVVAVRPVGRALEVVFADTRKCRAKTVVLATPLRRTAESIQIDGLSEDMRTAMVRTPTWMAQQAKAVIIYDRPFWREAGLSGRVASRLGPLIEVHDHSPFGSETGALFGFVGWDATARAAQPDGLKAAILAQLGGVFGPRATTPALLKLQDWAQSRHICAASDLRDPPRHPDVGPPILRAGHLADRLWFAVSETAALSPGLIEGALAAGESTAAAILRQN